MTTTNCKNCENEFAGNYCNNCGQSAHTHPINWHYVGHDIQHGVFHVDRGILYTLKELILRPGISIRAFLAGRRVDYFKPTAMVFILATIYGFLYHSLNITIVPDIAGMGNDPQLLLAKKMEAQIISRYSLYILMTIPLYALGSYLAFKKSGYNYVEHLVINLYLASLKLALQIITIPFLYLGYGFNIVLIVFVIADTAILFWVFGGTFNMFSRVARVLRTILSFVIVFAASLLVGIISGIVIQVLGM